MMKENNTKGNTEVDTMERQINELLELKYAFGTAYGSKELDAIQAEIESLRDQIKKKRKNELP